MLTLDELRRLKVGIFCKVVGCACWMCHCRDWEIVNISQEDAVLLPDGYFEIPDAIYNREKERILTHVHCLP